MRAHGHYLFAVLRLCTLLGNVDFLIDTTSSFARFWETR